MYTYVKVIGATNVDDLLQPLVKDVTATYFYNIEIRFKSLFIIDYPLFVHLLGYSFFLIRKLFGNLKTKNTA